MISKQKQIARFKSLLIDELKKSKVKERMISAIKSKGQQASGNLISVINKMEYSRMVRLQKSQFDSGTGIITRATVEINVSFARAPYAKFLDENERTSGDMYAAFSGRSNRAKMSRIISWLKSKPSSSFRSINISGASESKIKKIAFAIVRKLNKSNNQIKNVGDFISKGSRSATSAIDKARNRFVDYLDKEIASELRKQIFKAL